MLAKQPVVYGNTGPRVQSEVTTSLPQSPARAIFFQKGKNDIFELLQQLQGQITWDPNKLVLCGASNGGAASFTLAAERPELFKAIVALPGSLGVNAKKLKDMPIFLRGGRKDSKGWLKALQRGSQQLEKAGAN